MLFVGKKRNQVVRSQYLRLMRCAALFVLLVGILSTGLLNVSNITVAAGATDEGAGYTPDQLEGLNFLNEVRVRAGIPPVQLNAAITKAAIAHAEFYNTNQADRPCLY